jgi:hypothetical protein
VLSLDYEASARLKSAYLAVGVLDKPLRKRLKEYGRDEVVPMLMREARTRASGRPVLGRVVGSGRYSEYKGIPGVTFGGKRAVTSTGVPGRILARGAEFGSQGTRTARYRWHSPDGTPYELTRRTSVQFRPDTGYQGHAISPAAEAISDRVLTGWLELVEQLLVEAFDGRLT